MILPLISGRGVGGNGGEQRLAEARAEGRERGAEAGDPRGQEPAVRLLLEADDREVAAGQQPVFLHAAIEADRHELVDQHHRGRRLPHGEERLPSS